MYVYIVASRIPYGMRGLKYTTYGMAMRNKKSHPIRDAWIEILQQWISQTQGKCRIPYGMRGLKWKLVDSGLIRMVSHPIRDAWIEIRHRPLGLPGPRKSHPIRDAWIEIR